MLISVLNIKVTCEWHKAIKLNYKNTRTHVILVLRVTKHFTCAVAARNALESAVDKDGQCAAYGYYVTRTRYSTWNRKKTALFSDHYLRNRSTLFWFISVYFNIRNTLPKFCPFLLGHPIFSGKLEMLIHALFKIILQGQIT